MSRGPGEIDALRAALAVAEARADAAEIKAAAAEAEAARVTAQASSTEALIAHLKLEIEKLRRAALWQPLGAQGSASGAHGAAARGSGGDGHRG